MIEKVVLLTELQLLRTPYCFPYVLNLLYDLQVTSEKAHKLFKENMMLFHSDFIKDDPWGWFNFFYKTRTLFPEKYAKVNEVIMSNGVFQTEAERIRWHIVTGKEVEPIMLKKSIGQAQTRRDAGLLTGLSGLGMSLLCMLDKNHLTWIGLI